MQLLIVALCVSTSIAQYLAPPGGGCPKPDGSFRAPGSICSGSYLRCSQGKPETRKCRDSFVFNPILGDCDRPDRVFGCGRQGGCGANEVEEECGTQCPPTCGTLEPGPCPLGCIKGCQCLPGFVRDRHGLCVRPQDCEARHVAVDEQEVSPVAFKCESKVGNFSGRNWNNCGRNFVRCFADGSQSQEVCAEGQVFDDHQSKCIPRSASPTCSTLYEPHRLGGGETAKTESEEEGEVRRSEGETRDLGKIRGFTCEGRSNGMYGQGCEAHFWWCWDGVPTRQLCVQGTFFDEKTDQCAYYQDVPACGGSGARDAVTTTPRAPIQTTPKPKLDCTELPDGDYADPDGGCISSFFICSNAFAFRRQCPPALAFDPTRKICDYKDHITACGGSNVADPSQDYVCPQAKGDFADPLRPCTGYYWWCMEGEAMYTRCSGNMIFNPATGLCDRRRNVLGCNGRVPTGQGHDHQHGQMRELVEELLTKLNTEDGRHPHYIQSNAYGSRHQGGGQSGNQAGQGPTVFTQNVHQSTGQSQSSSLHTGRQGSGQSVYRSGQGSTFDTGRQGSGQTNYGQGSSFDAGRQGSGQTNYGQGSSFDAGRQGSGQTQYSGQGSGFDGGFQSILNQAQESPHTIIIMTNQQQPGQGFPTNQGRPEFGSFSTNQGRTDFGGFSTNQGQGDFGTRPAQPAPPTHHRSRTFQPAPEHQDTRPVYILPAGPVSLDRTAPNRPAPPSPRVVDVPSTVGQARVPQPSFLNQRPVNRRPVYILPKEPAQPTVVVRPETTNEPFLNQPPVEPKPKHEAPAQPPPPTHVRPETTESQVEPTRVETDTPSQPLPPTQPEAPKNPSPPTNYDPFLNQPPVHESQGSGPERPAPVVEAPSPPYQPEPQEEKPEDRPGQSTGKYNPFLNQPDGEDQSPDSRPDTPDAPEHFSPFLDKSGEYQSPDSRPDETPETRPAPVERPEQPPAPAHVRSREEYGSSEEVDTAEGYSSQARLPPPQTTKPRHPAPPKPASPKHQTQDTSSGGSGSDEESTTGESRPLPPRATINKIREEFKKPVVVVESRPLPPHSRAAINDIRAEFKKPVVVVTTPRPVVVTNPPFTRPPVLVSKPGMGENHCADQADGTLITFGPCSRDYCECQANKPILRQCDGDQVFNPSKRACIHITNAVECGATVPVTTPKPDPSNHCAGQADGTLISFGSCSRDYCLCQGGKPILQQCDGNEVFSPQLRDCVHLTQAKECGAASPSSDSQLSDPSNHCAGQRDGTLIAFGPCSRDYCECQANKPILRQCDGDQVFSPSQRTCVFLTKVAECGAYVPPVETTDPNHCAHQLDGTLISFGSCSRDYCECQGYKPILRQCDGNQVFNPSKRACIHITKAVECGVSIPVDTPPVTEPTPEPEANHCAHQVDGTLISFGSCSRDYCECQGYKPILRQCGGDEVFHPEERLCIHITKAVECGAAVPVVVTTVAPDTDNHCANQRDGTLISFGSCSRDYCECQNYKPILRQCGGDEVFHPQERTCIHITKAAECGATPVTTPPPIDEDETNHCANQRDGTLISFGSCSRDYCECQNYKPILRQCAGNEVFHPQERTCILITKAVECGVSIPVDTPPAPESETNHCAHQEDGTLISFGSCSRDYCECQAYKPILRQCGGDEVFHPQERLCIHITKAVECGATPVTKPPPIDGTNHCADQTDGTLISFGSCSRDYCECQGYKPILLQCAGDQVFNPAKRACIHITNVAVECGATVPVDTPPLTTLEPDTNHCADQTDGTLISFGSCSRDYCECQGFKPILRQCGGDQVFDPASRACLPLFKATKCGATVSGECAGQADGAVVGTGCGKEYALCEGGRSRARSCLDGKIFSTRARGCVYETDAPECGGLRPVLLTPKEPVDTTVPLVNYCEGQAEGTLIGFSDCSPVFAECRGSIPFVRHCPKKRIFSPFLRACIQSQCCRD